MEIKFTPIGFIHSPFHEPAGMPIQPSGCQGVRGWIDLQPEYQTCLKDLEGYSHIYALYHFHKSEGWAAEVIPFLDVVPRGLFSTRAPRRPNPIGLSVLKLDGVSGCRINVSNVDILDGTPLLDLKPYVPQFDMVENLKIGWLQEKVDEVSQQRSDQRFTHDRKDA
jgi:tRNA-Thr(GGU) m(6)t(6)A37 methyltransferase TsaA